MLHARQVLEVLADDSNFRGAAMRGIAAPAAAALSLPAEAFESAWCAGEDPGSGLRALTRSRSCNALCSAHSALQAIVNSIDEASPWAHHVFCMALVSSSSGVRGT